MKRYGFLLLLVLYGCEVRLLPPPEVSPFVHVRVFTRHDSTINIDVHAVLTGVPATVSWDDKPLTVDSTATNGFVYLSLSTTWDPLFQGAPVLQVPEVQPPGASQAVLVPLIRRIGHRVVITPESEIDLLWEPVPPGAVGDRWHLVASHLHDPVARLQVLGVGAPAKPVRVPCEWLDSIRTDTASLEMTVFFSEENVGDDALRLSIESKAMWEGRCVP